MLLSELARELGGTLAFGEDRHVAGLCSIEETGPKARDHLSFLTPQRNALELLRSQVQSFLVAELPTRVEEEPGFRGKSFVVVGNPELAFARVLARLHPRPVATTREIHPQASVAEDAILDGPVRVGPFAVIESGARIGAGSVICAGAFVGAGTVLGAECLLHAHAVVYHGCRLGDRVILHSGSVIGADGFGYAPDGPRLVKLPQIGGVVLGDDVEIGANSCVDRGALYDTEIGEGTKIDDLVIIGHNSRLGAHIALAGQTGIAGSTRIGDRCRFGGQVGVVGHLNLPSDVHLTAKTGVLRNMVEPGVYSGSPALPRRENSRIIIEERRLPEYRRRIRELEKRLDRLEGRGAEED